MVQSDLGWVLPQLFWVDGVTSEDVDEDVEEEEDYGELEEEMEEDQDYESSTADYEDTPGSSTSSSFAAYTDQEMNQKSQR